MTICIKCRQEYDEKIVDGCAQCTDTEALFRLWRDVQGTKYETVEDLDFDEDIIEKHPIISSDDVPNIENVYTLEYWLERRLHIILRNRQKHYKRKKGASIWDARFSSTPIWKKDTTGKRKAPLVSATCFDIGEQMKGKDGTMYVVKSKKDGSQFWARYRAGWRL